MSIFKQLADDVQRGDSDSIASLVNKGLAEEIPVEDILNKGLIEGMNIIGEKYKKNEVFIPEILVAAKAMNAGLDILKPLLIEAKIKSKGKVLVGTVKGDLHDIGKNIVGMMLQGAGFDVIDLGTEVSNEKFLEHVKNDNADIIGMSTLLTTTMIYMKELIETLEQAGLRDEVKVIIGGAPITQAFADEINADGYAPDAASGVDLCKKLMSEA